MGFSRETIWQTLNFPDHFLGFLGGEYHNLITYIGVLLCVSFIFI